MQVYKCKYKNVNINTKKVQFFNISFLDALASLALLITVRGVRNFSRLQIMRYLDFD